MRIYYVCVCVFVGLSPDLKTKANVNCWRMRRICNIVDKHINIYWNLYHWSTSDSETTATSHKHIALIADAFDVFFLAWYFYIYFLKCLAHISGQQID